MVKGCFFVCVLIVLVTIVGCVDYLKYLSIKENYFPNMTYTEYVIYGDKIRITPNNDK